MRMHQTTPNLPERRLHTILGSVGERRTTSQSPSHRASKISVRPNVVSAPITGSHASYVTVLGAKQRQQMLLWKGELIYEPLL